MVSLIPGSNPGWRTGYVPSAAEWNMWWSNKGDSAYLTPLLYYDLRLFGAKSNGVTDDSGALNAAIAALCAAPPGGRIILPPGRTVIGSAIVANIPATVAMTIEGMGPGASELYFSNATNGLQFTLLNSGVQWGKVSLHGFSLTRGPTSPVSDKTGIYILADPNANLKAGTPGVSFRDLLIAGSSPQVNQWQNSMILQGVCTSSIDNVYMIGILSNGVNGTDALLTITGTQPGSHIQWATNNNIVNCTLVGATVGLLVNGFVQGIGMANTTVIGQYDSVRWAGTSGVQAESINITSSNMAAIHCGVFLQYVNQNSVSGSTIIVFNPKNAIAFTGVEITNGFLTSVVGNNITGSNSGNEDGILINNAPGLNVVSGNCFFGLTGTGIALVGTTATTMITGNNMNGGTEFWTQQTSGNLQVGNMWNGAVVT